MSHLAPLGKALTSPEWYGGGTDMACLRLWWYLVGVRL